MEFQYQVKDSEFKLKIEENKNNNFSAEINGDKLDFTYLPVSKNAVSLLIGDKSFTVYVVNNNSGRTVFVNGQIFEIEDLSAKGGGARSLLHHEKAASESSISAPMPGRVLKILVSAGQMIEADDPLFIVESMKMENEVKAPFKGRIKTINFEENALVTVGDTVIELEKEE